MADAPNYNKLWSVNSKEKNQLTLGVFNRSASFSVFMGDSPGKPKFKHPLNDDSTILLEEYLQKLLEAHGEQRECMIITKFDPETKQSTRISQMTFIKDAKGVYSIECYNKELGSPVIFILRSTSTYTTGGDGLSLEKKSELAVRSLIKTLKDINLAKWNSPQMPMNRNGGGGKSWGNNSRPSESKDSGGGDLFD